MLTQCPDCLTIFRVTGQILRMGHGQVRCGRCNTQFDALDRLLDDDEGTIQTGEHRDLSATLAPHSADASDAAADSIVDPIIAPRVHPGVDGGIDNGIDDVVGESPGEIDAETDFAADLEEASRNLAREATAVPQSTIVVDEPEALEEITMEGKRIEITGTYRSVGEDGAAVDGPLERTVTEEWARVGEPDDVEESEFATDETLFDPKATNSQPDAHPHPVHRDISDFVGKMPAIRPFPDLAAAEFSWLDESEEPEKPWAAPNVEFAAESAIEPAAAATPFAAPFATSFATSFEGPITAESADFFDPPPAKSRTPLWAGLSACALLLLFAQILHHYRHEWVRHPQVGPIVSSIYGFLGMPLTPDWNPAAYDVQQWGAAADPAKPGTLRVRATIANRAAFAQPYPLLRLVLEDRWGDQVGVRDFQPREYLQPGVAPDRLLAPAQKADAEIVIVDPGQDAVGFHLDICLQKGAAPVCANEPNR